MSRMCKRKRKATRRVKEEREETSSRESKTEEVNRIDRDHGWPGTSIKTKGGSVRHIATVHFKGTRHRWREEDLRELVFKD